MYRREDGAEPLSTYQQRLLEVYMPPEFSNSNMEPTLAGDVFRYQNLTPHLTPSVHWQVRPQMLYTFTAMSLHDLQLLHHPAGDCHSQWPHPSKSPQLRHVTSYKHFLLLTFFLRKNACFRLRSQVWRAHGVLLYLSSSPVRPTAPVPVQRTMWRSGITLIHPSACINKRQTGLVLFICF